MPSNKISFITPVFNEELNITTMLHNLQAVVSAHPHWNAEIIVINDGSTDGTRKAILECLEAYPNITLIHHEKNQGYTRSLKDGISRATGDVLMYVGADEEFDCSEIPLFIEPLIRNEADVVLGVRWQRNAYKLFRFFLSVIYIFILNYLFKLRVNDYNWSQAWRRSVLESIELHAKSLFVLPEIVIKAIDLSFRVKEIPSNHRGRQFGKSSVNFKIMGYALWEALSFWRLRNSRNYHPAATDRNAAATKLALPSRSDSSRLHA